MKNRFGLLNTKKTNVHFQLFHVPTLTTSQSIASLEMVPIEILRGKRHITWVLAVLLFKAEFQMEPLAPYAISYDTTPATYYTNYWLVQI